VVTGNGGGARNNGGVKYKKRNKRKKTGEKIRMQKELRDN
jgi:hypothetical protein